MIFLAFEKLKAWVAGDDNSQFILFYRFFKKY